MTSILFFRNYRNFEDYNHCSVEDFFACCTFAVYCFCVYVLIVKYYYLMQIRRSPNLKKVQIKDLLDPLMKLISFVSSSTS